MRLGRRSFHFYHLNIFKIFLLFRFLLVQLHVEGLLTCLEKINVLHIKMVLNETMSTSSMSVWKLNFYHYEEVVSTTEKLLDEYVEANKQEAKGTKSAFSPVEQVKLTYRFWLNRESLSELATCYGVAFSTISRTIARVEVWILRRLERYLETKEYEYKSDVSHSTRKWLLENMEEPQELILFRLTKLREEREHQRMKLSRTRRRGRPEALTENLYEAITHRNKYEKLTVEEACRASKVSRASFYRYKAKREAKLEADRRSWLDMIDSLKYLCSCELEVEDNGLTLNHIAYYSDNLKPWINTLHPEFRGRRRKFSVRYDPRDMSCMYFFDPDKDRYFAIPYANPSHSVVNLEEIHKAIYHLERRREEATATDCTSLGRIASNQVMRCRMCEQRKNEK